MAERFRDKFGGDSFTKGNLVLGYALDFLKAIWPIVVLLLLVFVAAVWLAYAAGASTCGG